MRPAKADKSQDEQKLPSLLFNPLFFLSGRTEGGLKGYKTKGFFS